MRMVCVDLETFDGVDRELLWHLLERYGVRGRLKEAVESLYFQSAACVLVQRKNSEWFEAAMGVRQGCTMCSSGQHSEEGKGELSGLGAVRKE